MRHMQDKKHTGRLVAWGSAAVLVAGSVGFTVPAFAAQPDNPSAHGQAQSQAHSQAAAHQSTTATQTTAKPSRAKTHSGTRPATTRPSSTAGHQGGGSSVSLDRPNDFQAQADPDGMENGGVDQPGGTGGIDTTTQDGNNGSGNDVDCEDDNRGVGVPGHCKQRPETGTPDTSGTDEVPAPQGDLPGGILLSGQGGLTGQPAFGSTQSSGLVLAPSTGLDTALVSAPTPRTAGLTAAAQAGPAGSLPSVLPNTGAGQALLGLSIAALAALALGTGLVRRGRRTAHVIG